MITPVRELATSIKIPDLWQQEAIRALEAGRDVVVDAPTGAGKTYIFELLIESGFKGKAIYTVPTRALANDKLLEWLRREWNTGIATGDVSENLEAPVVVATLETQKYRLMRAQAPDLLVIDEYQMLAHPSRGVNYEMSIALAPRKTQLLLLSGTVGNPGQVMEWLRRLGRDAVLVQHHKRPVPLDEIHAEALRQQLPSSVRGFWPRLVARALAAGMGPVLAFAPQRRAAENLARQAAALPCEDPLILTPEQRRVAGPALKKMLKNRIACHHSGLSYRQRCGVIEPLAKNGHLRLVVATMGLSAGINFSLRSVIVTGREYRDGDTAQLVRPDELLQMFGRAGRRGLDEKGYVIVLPGKPRLNEGQPLVLKRTNQLDWPSLLAVMRAAVKNGEDPREKAEALTARLFSEQKISIGLRHIKTAAAVESAAAGPSSGLAAQTVVEILNSEGKWERRRAPVKKPLGQVLYYRRKAWHPAVSCAGAFGRLGEGALCKLRAGPRLRYGRELPLAKIADEPGKGELVLTRQAARLLRKKNKTVRRNHWSLDRLEKTLTPMLAELTGGGVLHELTERKGMIIARLDYARAEVFAIPDSRGAPLLNPPAREVEVANPLRCRKPAASGGRTGASAPAQAWLQLGLIDGEARPTRRGAIFSFFNRGEGLAVAAALEDETYPVEELVRHLANLRAGHRFGEHEACSSRLGKVCRETYRGDYPGYLRRGLPPDYGDGAAEILAAATKKQAGKIRIQDDSLPSGDIERAALEWRSLLHHIGRAPDYPWNRWRKLRDEARKILALPAKPSLFANLPPLAAAQQARYKQPSMTLP